jgi:outer membrane protein assembly factor BamA
MKGQILFRTKFPACWKRYSRKAVICLLLLSYLSAGWSFELKISGNPYFSENILNDALSDIPDTDPESIAGAVLDLYVEKGFPLALVTIDSVTGRGPDRKFYLNIDSGDYVRIEKTVFSGANFTKHHAMMKRSGLADGRVFNERTAKEASDWLFGTELFTKRPTWKIFKDAKGYGLNYTVSEKKYNELMLMAGYASNDAGNEYSVYAGLKFDNLFGTMRKSKLLWDRNGEYYERIKFYFKEPFLMSFPLSTEVHFNQNYKKDAALRRLIGAGQEYYFDPRSSVNYGMTKETVYPDSLYSGSQNMIGILKYHGGFGYSTLYNAGLIPDETGWKLKVSAASVQIDIKDSVEFSGSEVLVKAGLLTRYSENIYLDLKTGYEQAFFKENVPEFGRINFGGASSFRGYREDFFISDVMILNSADLIFATDPRDLAFSLFADLCAFNPGSENISSFSEMTVLRSYGGGLIYESGSGVIHAVIGVPEKEGFSQSVVHVRYSVRF